MVRGSFYFTSEHCKPAIQSMRHFVFLDKKSRIEEVHDLNFDAYGPTFPAMLWLALLALAFM